ncbi:MAG: MFS transporter [Puniceicoccaceae bacterium]
MPDKVIPVDEHVPLKTKMLWGAGGLADNFMFNTLVTLGLLVYVDFYRMDAVLAGVALFLPRFVDAITDPWIGNLSDNTHSRWGRRRPYILGGVIVSAILLPLLWTPPLLESVQNVWWQNAPFFYLCLVGSALAISYTCFVVPYTALGWELTPNYDERTRVISWRMYIGLFGSLTVSWLYRATQLDWFDNIGSGAVWVSVILAWIVLVTGLMPFFGCRETGVEQSQAKIKLVEAVRYTLTNRAFLILFVAYIIIIISLFSASGVMPFLFIYYVFGGDKVMTGNYTGMLGTLAVVMSYLSMFLLAYISTRSSKRIAMLTGLGLALAGTLANWWAIHPDRPWALFVAAAIAFLGLQGCWLMVDSMVGDICDDDELASGRRREGMFSAVKGFALKLAQALTSLIGAGLLALSGYDPDIANTTGISIDTALRMKALVIGFQSFGLLIAIGVMVYYPITRARANATRKALEKKRGKLKMVESV